MRREVKFRLNAITKTCETSLNNNTWIQLRIALPLFESTIDKFLSNNQR